MGKVAKQSIVSTIHYKNEYATIQELIPIANSKQFICDPTNNIPGMAYGDIIATSAQLNSQERLRRLCNTTTHSESQSLAHVHHSAA